MKRDQAIQTLRAEITRLRSGAGGYGGRSPQALELASAIEAVLEPQVPTIGEGGETVDQSTSTVRDERTDDLH